MSRTTEESGKIMASYTKRPETRTSRADAAVYRFGEPLDELLRVARREDPDAEVVEVPQWRVLLVRHTEVPDHAPSYTDYDVMEDGQMLVFSHDYAGLYITSSESFLREWEPTPPDVME